MKLRSGYKQTELGMIPDDWNTRRLIDLGRVVRGGSPRPAGDPRYFNGNFIPWLTVGSLTNIASSQQNVSLTARMLTESGSKRSRTLEPGTLVLVNSGARTLGVSKILEMKCCANDGIAALVDQKFGERRFLCYFLNSQITRLRQVVAAGNDQLNLNTHRIGLIVVPFPPEKEQGIIADALSDADKLLCALDRLIAKRSSLKQATMEQLLTGKIRLPGFNEEWVKTRLGDIAETLKGSGLSRDELSDAGRRRCILYGELFTIYSRVIPEATSRTDSREGLTSVSGDILMPASTTTSGVDLAIASAIMMDGVALGGDINVIRQKSLDYDPIFLSHYITYTKKRQISELTQGVTIHHLYGKSLKTILLTLPCRREQIAIAAVLSDMEAEIESLKQRRAKTAALKEGMMQELLTGSTRLV